MDIEPIDGPLFSKLAIRNAKHVDDKDSEKQVYHVYDPHALIQAAGYAKFKCAKYAGETVFFRGQRKFYPSLSPSLFRGFKTQAAFTRRISALYEVMNPLSLNNKIFQSFPKSIWEPLLQHYGLRTTWIDLVDNIWVALWFACHNALSSGKLDKYLHFERRSFTKESGGFAYILLVAAKTVGLKKQLPGYWVSDNTELVDLRIACPSVFLRPHAQHGVLFRMRGDSLQRPGDYYPQVRGVLRIDLFDALSWLGVGSMLDIHALFPPPYYDHGYKILLDAEIQGNPMIGAISHVGA